MGYVMSHTDDGWRVAYPHGLSRRQRRQWRREQDSRANRLIAADMVEHGYGLTRWLVTEDGHLISDRLDPAHVVIGADA